MYQAILRPKRRKTVLALTLALGVGLPPPAQAYLLDCTVASIHPEVFISYAPGAISRPPPVKGNLKVIGVSRLGALERQCKLTHTIDDNFNPGLAVRFTFPAGPSASPMDPDGNILNHFAQFSSTLLLLGSGLMGLVGLRCRRRRG